MSDNSTTRCRRFSLNVQLLSLTITNFLFSKFFEFFIDDFVTKLSSFSITKTRKFACQRKTFNCICYITTKRSKLFVMNVITWKIMNRLISRSRRISRRNHDSKLRINFSCLVMKLISIERFFNVSKRSIQTLTRRKNRREIIKHFLCIWTHRSHFSNWVEYRHCERQRRYFD